MIYTRREKYPEAIKEYTQALNDLPFSKARGMRAATYLKMNMLDSAMYDYKKAYSLNYEYSLQIAATFELMNKKDSAQKYYQIYLEHYPSDKAVQEKVKLLTSQ
jgi:tetratricopeptide (TPR) repeat protein